MMQLALFALFLVLVALASAAQLAFSYLNATRLRHLMQQGASRAEAMSTVVQTPGTLNSSVALVYMAGVAGATIVVYDFVVGPNQGWGLPGLAIVVIASLLVFMAHAFGRALATIRPEPTAQLLYPPFRLVGPLTLVLTGLWYVLWHRIICQLFGVSPEDRIATTEEDLRILVDAVEDTQALEEDERDMIHSIFEMSDRDVSQIMVPRVDLVAVEATDTVSQAIDVAVSSGHSRLPVYEGDLDHVAGLVHLRDLAEALRRDRDGAAVAELVRPLHVVPETKKIDELLREFQQERLQMALVADEYGGTAGIVTIEDLVEEIVGEIRDEYDVEEERIQMLSDREAIVDAGISIHDANEVLPLNLNDDDYDTIGGLVYDRLAKIPTAGDEVELDHFTLKVLSTKGRRVQRVQIIMREPRDGATNGTQ